MDDFSVLASPLGCVDSTQEVEWNSLHAQRGIRKKGKIVTIHAICIFKIKFFDISVYCGDSSVSRATVWFLLLFFSTHISMQPFVKLYLNLKKISLFLTAILSGLINCFFFHFRHISFFSVGFSFTS
jgi:hypothetical protein